MVDVLRFVSADTTIDVMVQIQLTDVLAIRSGHPLDCFGVSDSFACVLRNETVLGEIDCRETTEAAKIGLHD